MMMCIMLNVGYSNIASMAFGRLWLQIGMSGWLTGDYSLRCQPVDYSDRPQVLRVGLPNALLTQIFLHYCVYILTGL